MDGDDSRKKSGPEVLGALDKLSLNRRSFLKGLVAAGLAAEFGGLLPLDGNRADAAPQQASGTFVTEPSRKIPVLREVDVLVVGGGMAGVSAATTAARMGMKTMLVEYFGFLGGNATAGLVNDFCGFYTRTAKTLPLVGGMGAEIVQDLLDGAGGRKWRHVIDFDPEVLKIILDRKLAEAGVEPVYYTQMAAPVMEGSRVTGIFIENKAGRQAILAKVVLDCTGDGDVCAAAGAPFTVGDGAGDMQACDMAFRLGNVDEAKFDQGFFFDNADRLMAEGLALGEYKLTRTGGNLGYTFVPGVYWANMARIPWGVDGTNPQHLTKSSIEGRQIAREFARFLKDRIPGLESSAIVETATKIGLRETRRVHGLHMLSDEEVLGGMKFADGVAANAWPMEMHISGQLKRRMAFLKGDDFHTIPFRCLVPQKVEGVLMAGRFISCSHNAQASIRVSGPASAMGHAVGVAAALAVRGGTLPAKVEVAAVQRELVRQGAFLG
jgi:hypothetical protein